MGIYRCPDGDFISTELGELFDHQDFTGHGTEPEPVMCETHGTVPHPESAGCAWPHLAAPAGRHPVVGHPLTPHD